MDIARVVGKVVARQKDKSLEELELCILQPLDESLNAASNPLIATEATTGRSEDDIVYYVASGDAVYSHPDGRAIATDAAVMGLVDRIDLES